MVVPHAEETAEPEKRRTRRGRWSFRS
jgi:hypothetical protein